MCGKAEADMLATRRSMAASLARRGVADARVLDAMARTPRERFVSEAFRADAYADGPLPIGGGQTISQPLVVALMAEAAAIGSDDVVLEVGAGSGYAAAVLGLLAARVIAIERDPALARAAAERLSTLGLGDVEVVCGDGALGRPDAAPFDAIIVSAAPSSVPSALKEQLAIGGRLVVPVGRQRGVQTLMKISRVSEVEFREENLGGVRFVPLVAG